MKKTYKIVHYLNQFFGQIGGEESAFTEPLIKEGPVGPGLAFTSALGEGYEIAATVICGDNYIAQNTEAAVEKIVEYIKQYRPEIVIAGPAFNAGRYGPACGAVCKRVREVLQIPVVTGMFEENPGVEIYRRDCYIVKTRDSAAGLRAAVNTMGSLIKKLLAVDEEISPDLDHYFSTGIRKNVFVEKNGAERAINMLLAKLAGVEFVSELELPPFERVKPAPPIKQMHKARLALVTDAGLTDKENSFRLEAARASKYVELDITNMSSLTPDRFCSVHGGFDPSIANTRPDVLMPLDIIRELEKDGAFGSLHEILYSTTGNGTSLKNAKQFGSEIAMKLVNEGVHGVILTST